MIAVAHARAVALARALGHPAPPAPTPDCPLARDVAELERYIATGERSRAALGAYCRVEAIELPEVAEILDRAHTRRELAAGRAVTVDALARLGGTAPSLLRRQRAEGRLWARGGHAGRGGAALVDAAEALRWLADRS